MAQQLGDLASRVRAARGAERLDVHLLCQSNGGNICRYFAKYGTASLGEAETAGGSFPEGVRVEKVALVGTANGGSIRMLRELTDGRRVFAPVLGRWFSPETLFTFRSLFAELPDRAEQLRRRRGARP